MVKSILFLIILTVSSFAFKMEADIITVDSTGGNNSTHINFRQTYDTTPVVFLLASSRGGDSAALRIMNVTTSGFDVYTVEPESWDGPHARMTKIPYLAIEKGNFVLPNGDKIIAGSTSISNFQSRIIPGGSWTSVSYSGITNTPIVLGQIQTRNNERTDLAVPSAISQPWMTTAISSVSSSSFNIALERSETTSGTLNTSEDVAYLVMESSLSGSSFTDNDNNTIEYETIRTGNSITGWGTSYRVNFSKRYTNPVVLATKNTRNSIDGGWFRRTAINRRYIELSVDEDTANDSERDHIGETAGILLFSEPFDLEFSFDLSFKKSSIILSDPQNGTNNPKRIPGGIARYCFEITNTDSSNIDNIVINDTLHSGFVYKKSGRVIQSRFSSCNCSAITNTSGTASGSSVSIPVGTLTGGFFGFNTARACAYIEFEIN